MASYYLELVQNSLTFPPVSKEINVFFDECMKQVFAVSNDNDRTRVQVKRFDSNLNTVFLLQNKGHVISIKFSPNQSVLAIQRSVTSIDFVNFNEGSKIDEYSQTCKGHSTQIIGFCWTGNNDIVFVTNQGIEFYQVQNEKYSLKLIKTYRTSVNWFVFLPDVFVLLLSSDIMGNMIHPYIFKNGSITRLSKFEVENPPCSRNSQAAALLERDVTIANIYNNIYVVVLRNHPRSMNSVGAEIVLYQLQKEGPAKKTAVLCLGAVGRFAVNVVDNLISVHHQASKTSMIFDIGLQGDSDGLVTYYYPVLSPLPIEPVFFNDDSKTIGSIENKLTCETYSANWVVFQPNIIIDAKLGCLWKLQVKLSSLLNMINDKVRLIDFLLLRSGSKSFIISVLNQLITPGCQYNLGVITQVFDKLNVVYSEYLEMNSSGHSQDTMKENDFTGLWFQNQSIIEQNDMYVSVFQPFVEMEGSPKTVVAIILDYIRSLSCYKIQLEYYLNEYLIEILFDHKMYYQLHQFLQYRVFNDSKSLAFLLISLQKEYPPAINLALDMLKRLGNHDDIIEVLLERDGIICALKSLQENDLTDLIAPQKFLSAALATGDDLIFHTVFTFFQQRNVKLRKTVKFARNEQCEKFEILFEEKFGKSYKNTDENLLEKLEVLQL
ncbi:regulator of MON1-CCZ1 complex [Hydra vulgaris]|uniref:Regulator of MON1-CCZ1 complex n=1 Tax=Hydra vulgaris TaxID=6087 RepID=A0ABM4D392_HYDVU